MRRIAGRPPSLSGASMVPLLRLATTRDGGELVPTLKTTRSRARDACHDAKGGETARRHGKGEGARVGQGGDGKGKKLAPLLGGEGARTGRGGDGEGKELDPPWEGEGAGKRGRGAYGGAGTSEEERWRTIPQEVTPTR